MRQRIGDSSCGLSQCHNPIGDNHTCYWCYPLENTSRPRYFLFTPYAHALTRLSTGTRKALPASRHKFKMAERICCMPPPPPPLPSGAFYLTIERECTISYFVIGYVRAIIELVLFWLMAMAFLHLSHEWNQ